MPQNAPKTENNRRPNVPAWLETARGFYADTFGARRRRDLRAAREDWSDLTEEEQSFALAHLQYLDLMAQAASQNLLLQIRDILEEMADGIHAIQAGDDAGDEEPDEEPQDEEPEVIVPEGFEAQAQPQALPFQHPVPVERPTGIDMGEDGQPTDNDDWDDDDDQNDDDQNDEEEEPDDDGSGAAA